jgi:16S rRNA (uracil1498-N3)-methyltransferase
MPRFFVPPAQWEAQRAAWIAGPDARHLTRVLRLGLGAEVLLLDGTGRMFRAEIREADRERVWVVVTGTVEAPPDPGLRVTLVQAVAKGERMDAVMRQATEVGVARIIPVISERVVVRLTSEKADRRRERWQRIATEAAEQCRRPQVPEVSPVIDFNEALDLVPAGTPALFFWEGERRVVLKEVLRSRPPAEEVFLFIGPEGGFAKQEVAQAAACGAIAVSLGPRLLRTDTAGVVAVALVFYEWGDLG